MQPHKNRLKKWVRDKKIIIVILFLFSCINIQPVKCQESTDFSDFLKVKYSNSEAEIETRTVYKELYKPIQPITAHEQSDGTTIFEAKAFIQIQLELKEQSQSEFLIDPLAGAIPIDLSGDISDRPAIIDGEYYKDWYLDVSYTYCYLKFRLLVCEDFSAYYILSWDNLEPDDIIRHTKEPIFLDVNYKLSKTEYDYPSDEIEVLEVLGNPVQVEIIDKTYEEKTEYSFLSDSAPRVQQINTDNWEGHIDDRKGEIINIMSRTSGLGLVMGSNKEYLTESKWYWVGSEGLGRDNVMQGEIDIPSGDLIQSPSDLNRFYFYYQNNPSINKIIRNFEYGQMKFTDVSNTALNIERVQQCVALESVTKHPTITFNFEINLYAKANLEEGVSGTQIQKKFWDQIGLKLDPTREDKVSIFSKIDINWTPVLIIGVIIVIITSFMFTPRGKEFYATTQKQIKKIGKK